MPHIHKNIDFTLGLYIINDQSILLGRHKKLDKWLPIGGHIELSETVKMLSLGKFMRKLA